MGGCSGGGFGAGISGGCPGAGIGRGGTGAGIGGRGFGAGIGGCGPGAGIVPGVAVRGGGGADASLRKDCGATLSIAGTGVFARTGGLGGITGEPCSSRNRRRASVAPVNTAVTSLSSHRAKALCTPSFRAIRSNNSPRAAAPAFSFIRYPPPFIRSAVYLGEDTQCVEEHQTCGSTRLLVGLSASPDSSDHTTASYY